MSKSLAVKSVSGAVEEIHRLTSIGPVISTSSVSGSVWNVMTSGRSHRSG